MCQTDESIPAETVTSFELSQLLAKRSRRHGKTPLRARNMHRLAAMASKTKVLIVEDNSDLRRLYAIGLNQRGFEVKLAANGAEALDRVEAERPDLILLDLYMPIMDGWEVLERINPPGGQATPVIIVTGQAETPDHPPHASICSWLSKPVALTDLVQAITDALDPTRTSPKAGEHLAG